MRLRWMILISPTVKRAFIKTYGCQMNEQDSRQMQGLLAQAGYETSADSLQADLILLNTCSIREKAVHKIYSELGRLRPLKEDKKNLIVGVAGCVAEQEKEALSKRFPFLDLVFGPDHIRHLPELLKEVESKKVPGQNTVLRTGFDLRQDFQFVNVLPAAEESPVKAFVNIQKGCDNICSFCIVPHVRGREVSRPHEEIIDEINELVARGVKEVTLLGQNVNSYGLKSTGGVSFARLLERIAQKTTLSRLRFTTSHPKDVKDDLIDQFMNNPILVPHFHLPVQSGANRILNLMRRQYTREDYLGIVHKLKHRVPQIQFSTDIIVGFPTETDEEFEQTLSLMREVAFSLSFYFIYSPRPHTSAVKIMDDVPPATKRARFARLDALNDDLVLRSHLLDVGSVQDVLVEDVNEEASRSYVGRTPSNKVVHFSGETENIKPGDFVPVTILRANPYSLYGTGNEKKFNALDRALSLNYGKSTCS